MFPGFHDTLLADESHSDQEKNHIISIVLLVRVYPTAPMPVLGHRYQVLIVRLTHRFTRYRNRSRRPKNWHQSSAIDCAPYIKCLKTHLTWPAITTADLVQVMVRTASLRLGPGFEPMVHWRVACVVSKRGLLLRAAFGESPKDQTGRGGEKRLAVCR